MQDRKEQLHFTLVQNNVFWLLYITLGEKPADIVSLYDVFQVNPKYNV